MISSTATSSEPAGAKRRILLLSGTSEGPLLAQALVEQGFAVTATVTRDEACHNLFGGLVDRVSVVARGFTADSLTAYLAERQADLVVDATHPFAARITLAAHEACHRAGVPYLRYERPDWAPPSGTNLVDGFADAAQRAAALGRRIMLTIGSKQLKHFAHLQGRVEMLARILPSAVSTQQALAAGFRADQLIGLRPPFSQEFNRRLFEQHRIDVLVTKASGVAGGVAEKVLAARELGLAVVMIRRPQMPAIAGLDSVEAVVARCVGVLRGEPRPISGTAHGQA
jgi:precorrin-6A/cobalt-precorrin-6A reductase